MSKEYLEAIDNAKLSEALTYIEDLRIENDTLIALKDTTGYDIDNQRIYVGRLKDKEKELDTIKQALIKAQEQEKENAYIEKIKTMMKQKDCVLRYIESEDCFAVKTILSDGWYKLTPEFVDDNVREEIKPLPLIEKNKQLKEENAEYKRVLEILKKKEIDTFMLMLCDNVEQYNSGLKNKPNRQLTQEEFDLLKRWLG